MIERLIEAELNDSLFKNKAIILMGPRQVGKTTMLKNIQAKYSADTLFFNCDIPGIKEQFENISVSKLKNLFGGKKIIIIDEAQRILNIGITLKIITDEFKDIQLIASGSSSFDLANKINEPLTGRKFEFMLYPISVEELHRQGDTVDLLTSLETRLIYGMYPDVINNAGNEKTILSQLSGSFLYKDVFNFNEVRRPELLEIILKALAYQVGQEVSYNELAQTVKSDVETVTRYIYFLEQSYILFRLPAFSRNLRNELKRSRKVYFYDNGIRNTIISNYNPLHMRTDDGQLWENFMISERKKFIDYHKLYSNTYFWRTTQQQEIDYIEERNGKLYATEIKFNPKRKPKFPKTFLHAYTEHVLQTVNKENYLEWLIKDL